MDRAFRVVSVRGDFSVLFPSGWFKRTPITAFKMALSLNHHPWNGQWFKVRAILSPEIHITLNHFGGNGGLNQCGENGDSNHSGGEFV